MAGRLEVRIVQLGRGHTKGTTLWSGVPAEEVLYSGDLVEHDARLLTGDAVSLRVAANAR